MNDKRSQFSNMDDITKDIVSDKKGHNIVNDSFAHKPDGLLVFTDMIKKHLKMHELAKY